MHTYTKEITCFNVQLRSFQASNAGITIVNVEMKWIEVQHISALGA